MRRDVFDAKALAQQAKAGNGDQRADELKRKAFLRTFSELSTRIDRFMSLPLDKPDRLVLKKKLEEIGCVGSAT